MDRGKVLEKAEPKQILKHCQALNLDLSLLASCMAVNLKTVQRWQAGSAEPNEAGARALEKLETIYQLASKLLKKDSLKSWFHSPNATLGGDRPTDLLRRGELDQVRNVLGMLEWGIYS
jgi:ribosome-binding protein aMBF1 (putative translation factor)